MHKQIKIIILFFIILAIVSMSGQVFAQNDYEDTAEMRLLNNELNAKKKQLDTIKKEQEKYRKLIDEFQNEQSTLENQVSILENRISKAQLDITELELEIDELNLEIRKLGLDIQAKDRKINNEKQHLGNLLKMVNKQNQTSTLEILLLNNSLAEFLNQVKYLEDTNKEISSSLDDLKKHKKKLEINRQDKAQKNEELAKLKKNLETKRDALKYERNNKEYLLVKTEEKEDKYQDLLSEAKRQQEEASQEIVNLEQTVRQRLQKLEGNKLEALDSDFAWPVAKNYITSTFHDPSYPFRHLIGEHPAIDIRASQGSTLRAAASGYVAKVKFDGTKSYAYIMIIHADGYSTVYSHPSSVIVKEDDFVFQGQVIGKTGGMPGTIGAGYFTTGPHLHFEIRKEGIPVNPLDYLP
ncbi:MAG TPA: peptidoglycan DD-metalloendopeptidase family protein [Patescibacteria group bacterium]|nr:peptidoglycan DD-metalloendopeptidase family protein [Patescibacteria group bacterium]